VGFSVGLTEGKFVGPILGDEDLTVLGTSVGDGDTLGAEDGDSMNSMLDTEYISLFSELIATSTSILEL
jgi:hypothetical protein